LHFFICPISNSYRSEKRPISGAFLGLLLIAGWPATGLWVIGLFIGINLIVYGIAWIALAVGLRGS
jgi:uncharacterized membrane protein HdeD (DUF308 family)